MSKSRMSKMAAVTARGLQCIYFVLHFCDKTTEMFICDKIKHSLNVQLHFKTLTTLLFFKHRVYTILRLKSAYIKECLL